MSVAARPTRSSTTSYAPSVTPPNELLRLQKQFGWNISDRASKLHQVWHTESVEAVHFPDDAHLALFAAEDESFWFRHRNRVIERALRGIGMPTSFWEVGAGNGCVAHYLYGLGLPVVAIEPLAAGARNAALRGIESVCGRFESLALPDDSLPAVGCFDVIEHLEHPDELVGEVLRTLEPGGIFIVTVPAFRWLWSDADDLSGHFRRYTCSSLRKSIAALGFETMSVEYFMAALVAPMFFLRTIPSLARKAAGNRAEIEVYQRQMNDTRAKACRSPIAMALQAEEGLARVLPLPLGTSVLGVFRKPSLRCGVPSSPHN